MGNICYLGVGQNSRQANLVEWIILQRGKLPSTRGEGPSLIFGLSIVRTGAWMVALIAAVIALRRAGASRGPFILLILARVFLMGGRPFPAGTLAFGCFFLGAAWCEFGQRVKRTPDIA